MLTYFFLLLPINAYERDREDKMKQKKKKKTVICTGIKVERRKKKSESVWERNVKKRRENVCINGRGMGSENKVGERV